VLLSNSTPVVTLDDLNGEDGGKRLGLGTQRESLRVVRKIIDHYRIILVAKDTRDRRSPYITRSQ
jgi:hypothetical protein